MLFRVLTAGLVVIVLELIALGGLCITRASFSFKALQAEQLLIAEGSKVSDGANEAYHPYLGWVHNPQLSKPEKVFGRNYNYELARIPG